MMLRRTPLKAKRDTPRRTGPPAPRIVKDTNFRCKALLLLAEEAPHCMNQACKARNVGQVVAAHSNLQEHGKGTSLKAHDLPAYLCAHCHDLLDGRQPGLGSLAKVLLFLSAFFFSMLWLFKSGHLQVIRNPKPQEPNP